MRLYANQIGRTMRVFDLDTNKYLKGVLWVDVEQGLAEAYHINSSGKTELTFDTDGAAAWKTNLLKGRFKLVPVRVEDEPKKRDYSKLLGADKCGRCGSSMTLRGDELCLACKAKDRGKPLDAKPANPFELRKCERCSRDASWSVSDEVEVSPQQAKVTGKNIRAGVYLFDRGTTVGRRYFCQWHYSGPRLLDHKGEVMATIEDGHRPD